MYKLKQKRETETAATIDFLSNRYKKLIIDKGSLLNDLRKKRKSSFRNKVNEIINRL